MTRILVFALFIVSLLACNKDDSVAGRNTVNESRTVEFRELSMLVNIEDDNSNFLVLEKIDSLQLRIGDFITLTVPSLAVDTSRINKFQSGNFWVSTKKVSYLVIARPEVEPEEYETAGQYAEFLNQILELEPGEYVCLIEAVYLKDRNGVATEFFPMAYTNFTVEENTVSSFAGEINLKF
ncbi:MAG: hypothetical protein ACPF8V_09230 [Luteibaculum sp.]